MAALKYIGDTYAGNVVASGAAANSLARYSLAATFPLFTVPSMFCYATRANGSYLALKNSGIDWAGSLIGFLGMALLPIPFVLFRIGPKIRKKKGFRDNSVLVIDQSNYRVRKYCI